jgi:putative flippase GtrA
MTYAMSSSYWQVRAAGEPWRRALVRHLTGRTDALVGHGMRFILTGAGVSIVYITVTTVLAEVSHLRFQVALAIGWCAAVCVHFTLQRTFVWTHRASFALPFGRQVGRYLLVAVSQLGLTATTTAVLPSLLGVPAEAIYLGTALLVTVVNFVVFRNRIFHAQPSDAG